MGRGAPNSQERATVVCPRDSASSRPRTKSRVLTLLCTRFESNNRRLWMTLADFANQLLEKKGLIGHHEKRHSSRTIKSE